MHLPSTPRRAAVAATLLITTTALVGCVPNRPEAALEWFSAQPGVVEATVIADNSNAFDSSGTLRGELDPALDEAGLARLVDSIQSYQSQRPEVAFRLGRSSIDFSVSPFDEVVDRAIADWNVVSGLPGITSAVSWGDEVHARTLHDATRAALPALVDIGVSLELESFPSVAAEEFDRTEDDRTSGAVGNVDALRILWPAGCEPEEAELDFALSLVGRESVRGANLPLCDTGFDISIDAAASLSTIVPALYAELSTTGLDDFPVVAKRQVGGAIDGQIVAITPGEPAALEILATLDTGGAIFYTLEADRSLSVTEYSTPAADLVGLVLGSPTAATLPLVIIDGLNVTIAGTPAELPALLEAAVALAETSDQYGQIRLAASEGNVTLESPVGTDPDVVAAAADLRASGAWQGRTFTVIYLSTQLTIIDGVATVGDPNYTDGDVVEGFVEAWNAAS